MSIIKIVRDAVLGNKEREAVLGEIMGELNVSRGKAKELLFTWSYIGSESALQETLAE